MKLFHEISSHAFYSSFFYPKLRSLAKLSRANFLISCFSRLTVTYHKQITKLAFGGNLSLILLNNFSFCAFSAFIPKPCYLQLICYANHVNTSEVKKGKKEKELNREITMPTYRFSAIRVSHEYNNDTSGVVS